MLTAPGQCCRTWPAGHERGPSSLSHTHTPEGGQHWETLTLELNSYCSHESPAEGSIVGLLGLLPLLPPPLHARMLASLALLLLHPGAEVAKPGFARAFLPATPYGR